MKRSKSTSQSSPSNQLKQAGYRRYWVQNHFSTRWTQNIFVCVCMRACVCVCVSVCMYVTTVLRENWTEWTEVWYTTLSGVGILQPSQALAAMRIVGVASENVRVVTKIRLDLPSKWTSSVSFNVTETNYTPIDSSRRAESLGLYAFAQFVAVWREIQKIVSVKRIASTT